MSRRLALSCLLVIAAVAGGGRSAQAALAVSPTRVVIEGKAGSVSTGFFSLTNRGDADIEVTVEPEDWTQGVRGVRRAADWVSVQPKRLKLRPGKSARVKYRIRVPKEASGELRAQLFFTTETRTGSIPMRSRLGTVIYVGVEGTEHIEAAVTRWSVSYTSGTPGAARPDRLDVVVGIQNRGNAHIVPSGRILVDDEEGRRVATASWREGWGLLPKEEDVYHAGEPGVHVKPGRYTMTLVVTVGGDLRKPATITERRSALLDERWQFELLPAEAVPSPPL